VKCFRRGDEIKSGEQIIKVRTDVGIRYAHDRCVPSCPRCRREILPDGPYSQARSSSMGRDGLPVVEHEICPPH
jgi:hypothetical protein